MTEPVQKIYNSIQEALMEYARLGVNDRKERAKKVLYAYIDVEKDIMSIIDELEKLNTLEIN